MSNRIDLERRVAERLVAVSGTEMQVIAEEFARIQFPKRFSHIQVFGRNAQGQPTVGWPDAGVVHADGRIDAVEATRARAQDWRHHIKEDLEKAKRADYPNLAGFVFVAGHPEARCSAEERMEWRQKFVAAGVCAEGVDIVVGMDLVSRLCDPEFARLRYEVLDLAPRPHHFGLVIWTEENEQPGAFEPTRQEFLRGDVYRPALLDDVISRIEANGWTVVLGSGASGKTILAHLLTLEPLYRSLPSYYLNLAQFEGPDSSVSNELAVDLITFGHRATLFIVDNIHLNEDTAHDVLDAWKNLPTQHRPKLLLLGRETQYGKGARFGASSVSPLMLRAHEHEVVGLINRLARRWFREKGAEDRALVPPSTAIQDLLWTSGGDPSKSNMTVDLMALSAAVKRRLEQLIDGDWTLTEDDARAEVRETYLRPVSEEERRNLVRLAMLPEDFQLSERGLIDSFTGFEKSTESGLVFEKEFSRTRIRRYYFVHSALGRLIRSASEAVPDKEAEYRDLAISAPSDGFYLARRLKTDGQPEDAQQVLEAIAKESNWLIRFDGNLSHLQSSCSLLVRNRIASVDAINLSHLNQYEAFERITLKTSLGITAGFLAYTDRMRLVPAREAVVNVLEKRRDYLETAASHLSLGSLAGFLTYADRYGLDRLSQYVIAVLEKQSDDLAARALETGLNNLVGFLSYTERRNARKLFSAVVAGLERSPESFVVAALEAGLNDLAAFLDYADRAELLLLRAGVIRELEKQPDRLAATALQTTLNDLTAFLGYTNRAGLSSLREVVIEGLNSGTGALIETAIQTRFDHLSHFLEFTACAELQSVHNKLMSGLLTPNSISVLSKRACREPLSAFVTLLEIRPMADRIISSIDREEWERCRVAADVEQPTFFGPLVRKLTGLGRLELAEAPARNQVRGNQTETWSPSALNIVQLTQILRLAKPSEEEVAQFLSLVATPDWLEKQYQSAEISTVLGALFWIAAEMRSSHWSRFLVPALSTKIEMALSNCSIGWPGHWPEALSLLGVFAALGGDTRSFSSYMWPDGNVLARLIAMRDSGPEQERITILQFQLWLGLREMARLSAHTIEVSPNIGERVLAKARANLPYTGGGDLTKKLIAWLEDCARAGWIVVKESAMA
jgi:hypothetical protein